MVNLESFLTSYSNVFIWLLALIVFLGFMKAIFSVVKSIWKYFRKGVYDI